MHSDSIDTNIIVHGIVNDVPEQRKKIHAFLGERNTTHHVSILAIYEAVYVLEKIYQKPRKEIAELLTFFLTRFSDTLIYNQGLFTMAISLWVENLKLSFADCILATEAEINHIEPLYTLDKKLAKQAGAAKML